MAPGRARFRPPHCPNTVCAFHLDPTGWRCKRSGFYRRQARPQLVQRYRCTHCRRAFSSQTFSPTYWLRRPGLLQPIYQGLVSCAAFRQLARALGCSPSTVLTHGVRLGRHCLLWHEAHRPRQRPREPLVVDGFESFEHSQYYPFHANLAVGAESHFLYAFTDAELRRKGRMTPYQEARRAHLEALHGRSDPQALEREMAALIRLVAPRGGRLRVRSDEHPAYPRAFRRLPDLAIEHAVTPSRKARTARNPLFAVNRMDLLLRHSGANHKRETIAFSKRRQSAMERLAIFAVWVNFQKSRSEKKRNATPAQWLRLTDCKLPSREILRARLFPTRVVLPPRWKLYYERRLRTRARHCAPPLTLRYAN